LLGLLLFVPVHPQTLFAFMGRYLMSFPLFTTRHVGSYFFNVLLWRTVRRIL